ncbi:MULTISPECIES: hypothetical protein [Streptomyces]|uniref:Uncharacterized protein n=2 Tax=Streptomyces TaxID=1883 RepID=A0A124ECZ9_9ACTN|nr:MULTISPECIES: hypothetical protein [Streptomyces]KUH39231.1 hypothetical protein ATE80_08160 [Streptomyces kanasensis]UUS32678.1 hypothetical protein NRO40_18905 [Streptomyces changanensis]
MTRRPIALTTAVVLLAEAVGVVLLHGVLAAVLGGQRMSLAGLDPDAMITGTWVMGGVFGAYLALCGAVLLRVAVRGVPPGRWARILLVTCALTHAVLGAVVVGLVGWGAFAWMMVVMGLVVLTLVAYAPVEPGVAGGPMTPGGPVGGEGGGPGAREEGVQPV